MSNPYHDPEEGKRILGKVFELMAKTSIGRAALKSIQVNEVTIAFDETKNSCLHAHHPEYGHQLFLGARKPIENNGKESFDDPKILSYYARNIVHEMTHAEQKEVFVSSPEKMREKTPIVSYFNESNDTTYTFAHKENGVSKTGKAKEFVKHSMMVEAEAVFSELMFHEQTRRISPDYQKISGGSIHKETNFPEHLIENVSSALSNILNKTPKEVSQDCYKKTFDTLKEYIVESHTDNPSVQRWQEAYTREFTVRQNRHQSPVVPLEDNAAFSLPKVTLNSKDFIQGITTRHNGGGQTSEKPILNRPPYRLGAILPVQEENPKIEEKPILSLKENPKKRFDSPENQELWEKARDILPLVQKEDPKSFRTMAAMMAGVMNFNSKYIEEQIKTYKGVEKKEEKIFDLPEVSYQGFAGNKSRT